ncbi:hypothetical protein [Brevibacillus nitrificans]|uniref:hypothetical protein n=1 Tax=Brevibacillus nitrificans TaxID=651560 RepID=UPI002854FA47|nr:hypothetical protein [Brevibacillus nitrificans]MDR7319057.1 hypothetical protein [Brevibacillus nitrificans]
MKPTKPIKGNQQNPTPTPPPDFQGSLQEVCIRAPKVYDWILSSCWQRYQIAVPEKYICILQKAVCSGRDIYVSCLDPFSTDRAKDLSIRVLPPIRRTVLPVNGHGVPAGVVRTVLELCAVIFVFADSELLFDFTTTLLLQDELVVCVPETLHEEHIHCRIATGECLPFTGFVQHNIIELELLVCTELVVEVMAQIEIQAKPCLPRVDLIPAPPRSLPLECPPFQVPPCTPRL